MITNLLVGLNGTSFTPAVIAQAMELVGQHKCDVTGTSFLGQASGGDAVFGSTGSLADVLLSMHDRAESLMTAIEFQAIALQRLCERHGRRFRIGSLRGDRLRAVQRQSRFCDLTIFGPGGWSELDQVDDPLAHLRELTRAGVRPVYCVTAVHQPVERVLFCLRRSPVSCASWRHFLQLAPWPRATVVLLAIGEEEPVAGAFLNEAAALGRAHGLQVETSIVGHGDVCQVIIDQAIKGECQVVTVGPSEGNGLIKRIMGDVATELVASNVCPVLIID